MKNVKVYTKREFKRAYVEHMMAHYGVAITNLIVDFDGPCVIYDENNGYDTIKDVEYCGEELIRQIQDLMEYKYQNPVVEIRIIGLFGQRGLHVYYDKEWGEDCSC
jgi:hypothetical protein